MRDIASLRAIIEAHDKWRANRGGIGFACFFSERDQERAFAKADSTFAEAVSAALAARLAQHEDAER